MIFIQIRSINVKQQRITRKKLKPHRMLRHGAKLDTLDRRDYLSKS